MVKPFLRSSAVALLLIVAWELSGLDHAVSRLFGDSFGFYWQEHWFTQDVLHGGGRWVGWFNLGLIALNIWRPAPLAPFNWFFEMPRFERIWLVFTIVGCAALVVLLKRYSDSSCPWDFAEFGGLTPTFVSHWEFKQKDGGPGHCFPSGHASIAYSFLAGWFVLWPRNHSRARLWILGVMLIGVFLGLVQIVRGAHFVSHVMWAAILCWFFSGASAALFLNKK